MFDDRVFDWLLRKQLLKKFSSNCIISCVSSPSFKEVIRCRISKISILRNDHLSWWNLSRNLPWRIKVFLLIWFSKRMSSHVLCWLRFSIKFKQSLFKLLDLNILSLNNSYQFILLIIDAVYLWSVVFWRNVDVSKFCVFKIKLFSKHLIFTLKFS